MVKFGVPLALFLSMVTDVFAIEPSDPNYYLPDLRVDMLEYAETLLRIPYKWGGENKQGFDCSAFVKHVYAEFGIPTKLRVAQDLRRLSRKVSRENVKPGDLVFFKTLEKPKNGKTITHVGMVYEEKPDIIMIHASSKFGISYVNVSQSSYFKQRLVDFGTYVPADRDVINKNVPSFTPTSASHASENGVKPIDGTDGKGDEPFDEGVTFAGGYEIKNNNVVPAFVDMKF